MRRLLIPFLCLIGYASHGWQQQTPAQQFQQAINNCYNAGGGYVSPNGIIESSDPIYTYACVKIKGQGWHRDGINSHAKWTIILVNAPGNASAPDDATIESIGINNDVGGGITLADYVKTKTNTNNLEFRDLKINTAGNGIEIEHSGTNADGQPNAAYRDLLSNVRIISGATAAKITSPGAVIERCTFNTRKAGGTGGVVLKGEGSIRDCFIHDNWGAPCLKVSGAWSVDSMWIESVSPIVFDAAEISANGTWAWYRQPTQTCQLMHGSKLTVNGRVAFTDSGGGTNTTVAKCFVTDKTSAVMSGGVQVVAPAKN
jgi:hypothetical protein